MSNLLLLLSFLFAGFMAVIRTHRIDHGMSSDVLIHTFLSPLMISFVVIFVVVYGLGTLGLYSLGAHVNRQRDAGFVVPDHLRP